ncbi:hypothetical protein [Clostridium chrysemydis]|uniref:hypothetical protein n=1 Tax=Clostridium chrysemydis TaxID=2665504 RepID=UPI0018835BA6|nr:hypothetical protein [Clostridium chrysemydis]
MSKKRNYNKKQRAIDVDYKEVNQDQQEPKPTFEEGNYIIQVVSKGEIIKKLAVAGGEIYIQKLADGGLTVDLK